MQEQTILEVIASGDFDVLDTETTGLDRTSEIVSLALIASDGRVKLNTLIHPTRPIPKEATAIHGITNEMVKDALPFPAELLQELVRGRNIIIYNAGYDVPMLYRSTEAAGFPFVDWNKLAKWHCAMETFSEIYGDWNSYHGNYRWQKLSTAARYYRIEQNGEHGALVDCQTTLKVCKAMIEKPIE